MLDTGSAPINFKDKKFKIEDTKVAGRMVCCFLYLREVRHENKKFHFNRSYDFVVVFFSIFASVDASLCTRLFFCETGIANDTIFGKLIIMETESQYFFSCFFYAVDIRWI